MDKRKGKNDEKENDGVNENKMNNQRDVIKTPNSANILQYEVYGLVQQDDKAFRSFLSGNLQKFKYKEYNNINVNINVNDNKVFLIAGQLKAEIKNIEFWNLLTEKLNNQWKICIGSYNKDFTKDEKTRLKAICNASGGQFFQFDNLQQFKKKLREALSSCERIHKENGHLMDYFTLLFKTELSKSEENPKKCSFENVIKHAIDAQDRWYAYNVTQELSPQAHPQEQQTSPEPPQQLEQLSQPEPPQQLEQLSQPEPPQQLELQGEVAVQDESPEVTYGYALVRNVVLISFTGNINLRFSTPSESEDTLIDQDQYFARSVGFALNNIRNNSNDSGYDDIVFEENGVSLRDNEDNSRNASESYDYASMQNYTSSFVRFPVSMPSENSEPVEMSDDEGFF